MTMSSIIVFFILCSSLAGSYSLNKYERFKSSINPMKYHQLKPYNNCHVRSLNCGVSMSTSMPNSNDSDSMISEDVENDELVEGVDSESSDDSKIQADSIIESNETNTSIDDKTFIETSIKDPLELLIEEKEKELAKFLKQLESTLTSERIQLSKVRDNLSKSGKSGFYLVQAEVAEWKKQKEIEQKKSVSKNKIEFVRKLYPLLDSFREAPQLAPAPEGDMRSASMHTTFGMILERILAVLDKFGFKQFNAEVGAKYDPLLHEVAEVVEGETDGLIVEQVRPGITEIETEFIARRALVVVTKVPKPVESIDESMELQLEVENMDGVFEDMNGLVEDMDFQGEQVEIDEEEKETKHDPEIE